MTTLWEKKWGMYELISRTLHGSGFLRVPNYKFFACQSQIFKKWNKQHTNFGRLLLRGCFTIFFLTKQILVERYEQKF